MELAAAAAPPRVVVVHHHDDEAAEVGSVDLHGNVIKRVQIRRPIGPLSLHGDLLCASHGWGLTCVVEVVTGAVEDVAPERRKKVNSAMPLCVLGLVPASGEYKMLRLQADYLSRRRRQTCEVVTLGGVGDARRWRLRRSPPVTLSIEPGSSSWNVAAVAGLAYFLVSWGREDDRLNVEADSIAVFDLATEEWRPATLRGPLTSSLLASTDDTTMHDTTMPYRRRPHWWYCFPSLMKRFQLARLGDSLVVVYCNIEDRLTELWFLEDMGDDTSAPCWSKRYMLQGTPFAEDEPLVHKYFRISLPVHKYHYPLAVLGDGRILVWVDRTSAVRAYDPETSAWTDLATLTGSSVVGLHDGRLLCSNLGAVQPGDSLRRLRWHPIPPTLYIGVVLILVFSFIWSYASAFIC